jgi:hypothetical protein
MKDQEYILHYGREGYGEPRSSIDKGAHFRVMRQIPSRGEEPMLKSVTTGLVTFAEANKIVSEHNAQLM